MTDSVRAKGGRPKKTECDCGRPIKCRRAGAYVCAICYRIEREGFIGGPEGIGIVAGRQPLRATSAERIWREAMGGQR